MKAHLPPFAFAVAFTVTAMFLAPNAIAENVVETVSAAPVNAPTTIFRQVMPDGRIIYSDKAVKNGKIDETITVPPPIKGNLWTTEPGPRPKIPPQSVSTQIIRAPSASPTERKLIADKAAANVIRAEMYLEDAKRKQEDGLEPLPNERTGNADGKTHLNESYDTRQKLLAREVAYAEAALKKALAEQDALR